MPITRRGFLRLFSAASLAAIAPIDALGKVEGTHFTSAPFGVSLQFPSNWHELLPEEYLHLVERDYNDTGDVLLPIFMCTRKKEPNSVLNDSFQILADRFIIDGYPHPADLHAASMIADEEKEDFIWHRPITRTTFLGCPASTCSVSFLDPTIHGSVHHIYRDLTMVYHNDFVYYITVETDSRHRNRSKNELDDLYSSVSFSAA